MTERSTGPAPALEPPSSRQAGRLVSLLWQGAQRVAIWLEGPADRLARLWYQLRSASTRRRASVIAAAALFGSSFDASTKSVPSMSKNNAFLFILFSYRISAVSISAQHFAE